MAEKRWLVIPGYVVSRTDGEHHFVRSDRLMRLYGVRPSDCVILHPYPTERERERGVRFDPLAVLRPREDGYYQLHQCSACSHVTTAPVGSCSGHCLDPTGESCDAVPCPECGRVHYWTGSIGTRSGEEVIRG